MDNSTLANQIPLRHSVRSFTDRPIEGDTLETLQRVVDECNRESGLRLQLIVNEPEAFTGLMARYGRFRNTRSYLACVGSKSDDLSESVGYWGERVVLAAQALGLNSCWVGASYKKRKAAAKVARGEKLVCVIALGYGTEQGKPHKSKTVEQVADAPSDAPEWFRAGVQAALLAPTALNQQKFLFIYEDGKASVKNLGGPYSSVDLGIVKLHFELGSGHSLEAKA